MPEVVLNFTFRPCQPTDFETLYRIDRACYEPGIAYSRRTLRSFLTLRESHCWVACLAGEIAGFLIAFWEDGLGHVITIDVVESARRLGAGSALLALAEREMSQGGVRRVDIETATNKRPAIAFWNKHGYRAIGVHPRYYQGRIDAYLMSKRLAPPSAAK
ncbi:MAG TPA: N-acetyltransferase [Patescibacteria group bacterium]|nr:N-acetyltransferase [Patescibacteria group bacterium]